MRLSGIVTAIVTPFKDGQVDWASLKKLIRFQLERGIDGFVLSGTTGESPTLTSAEKKELFLFAKSEVAGQVPLIFGTGTNNTAETVLNTQEAETWGADAALVVVPYYNKPPQTGLVAHYRKVAASTRLPVLLYNVPGRTGVSLSLESIAELSRVNNIVGIKEATGDAEFARRIVEACGPDFLVTGGDDGAYLKVYESGGRGVISVLSHLIPDKMKAWSQKISRGDTGAHAEFEAYQKLTSLLFSEANPIPVKAALKMMGLIASDELRLPLVTMSEPGRRRLAEEMEGLGLI